MNIKRAKEEIEHTVRAYLAKDALGAPVIRNSRCLDQYAYRRYGGGDRDGDRACETI